MQRYFVTEKDNENNYIFSQSDIHHIKNVMRFNIDDEIEVVYQNKVYLCQISNLDPLKVREINNYSEDREIPINLTVAVALVNEQKFDLIIQKLTELGVSSIIPVKMERSIVKITNEKEDKKIERWQKICKEASEQCHRLTIPKIENVKSIQELITYDSELKLICSLNNNPCHLSNYLKENIKSILFVIGPEGGLTEKEEQVLIQGGFKTTTLGKRVLRVETAAIYVASIINYVYKG